MANFNNLSTVELITELQCILDVVDPCRNGVRTLTCEEIQALIYRLKQQADQVDTMVYRAEKALEACTRELKAIQSRGIKDWRTNCSKRR